MVHIFVKRCKLPDPPIVLRQKLGNVGSAQGLARLLSDEHERILKLGVHQFYVSSSDLEKCNPGKMHEVKKAGGKFLNYDKVMAYEKNVVALFTQKQDFENAVFVLEKKGREKDVAAIYKKHSSLFLPQHPIIFTPNGDFSCAAGSKGAIEELVRMLSDPMLKVVFTFGTFKGCAIDGKFITGCLDAGVASIRGLLSRLGRKDVIIASSQLVVKSAQDLS